MGLSKYKYLVVNGCSQTMGQLCNVNYIWPKLLADRLGLKLINLASSGSGWYTLETTTTSFIHNNRDIIHECLFILQKSMLERELDYERLPLYPSDIWEEYNIKYLPETSIRVQGLRDWRKFGINDIPLPKEEDLDQVRGMYDMFTGNMNFRNLNYFPEHRHYPNSRHHWKMRNYDGTYTDPKHIQEQIDELLLHFGQRMLSFHLFLKSQGADHIMVDGYSPFLSHKLNFRHYYTTDEELKMIKRFWSNKPDVGDEDEIMLYDFKNTKSGWIFDEIDTKYKIDDVVLWNLYMFKHKTEWNVDGGHAGPKGMELIEKVIYQNLQEKSWI